MFLILSFFLKGICSTLPYNPIVVPRPLDFSTSDGVFTLDQYTIISYDSSIENLSNVVSLAHDWIKGSTEFDLKVYQWPSSIGIIFQKPISGAKMENEEYNVTITKEKVLIISSSYNGFLYGFTTLLQLLPSEIFNLNPEAECKLVESLECRKYDWHPNTGIVWEAPFVTIHDKPRFGYRGIMLDTSRHFFTLDVIKRLLRVLSMFKVNMFQIHLTDDPGNRFESFKFPLFQEIGSVRKSSPMPWASSKSDETQYGPFYYKQSELRDLVRYASRLGITIVPEFEMPGHARGGVAPYCQYTCRQEPLEILCFWGGSDDVYCPGNDDTIKHLEEVLLEVLDIFPSKYIHIGGDECSKRRWKECPKCQARIKAEGLKDVNALQGWFVSHFSKFLEERGRRLVGWGEIIKGGVAESAIVMTWQGIMAGVEATKKGHNVLDDSNRHFYFNYKQFPADDVYEYNSPRDFVPFWYTYQKDPFYMIDEDKTNLILGVQASAWSEFIWGDEPDLHYKLFPRTTALSEVGWARVENKNWHRFYTAHVRQTKKRLQYMGIMSAPLMLHHDDSIRWSSADLKKDVYQVKTWNITGAIMRNCSYQAGFIKTKGQNDLKVRNLKILIDGAIHLTVEKEATASFKEDYSAFFDFKFETNIAKKKKIELQVELAGLNGNDCEGVVVVYATEFVAPYPTP